MTRHPPRTLSIWYIHDGRPGHLTQLQGLADRLSAHHKVHETWIAASERQFSLSAFLLKRSPINLSSLKTSTTQPSKIKPRPVAGASPPLVNLTKPDIVIGAGHKTHKAVLLAAKQFKAFSTLLMKPSLPLSWFNAIICPKHDGLTESKRILNTNGTINKISPPSQKDLKKNKRHKHLILIGGPSKHFIFDQQRLLREIAALCQYDKTQTWHLSNSPRTPASFNQKLKALSISNLIIHQHQKNTFGQLNETLKQSAITWVTADSMSMIYESLTSGARTAIFTPLPSKPKKPSRIAKQVQILIDGELVGTYEQWILRRTQTKSILAPAPSIIWEADRAAIWLLKRFQESTKS